MKFRVTVFLSLLIMSIMLSGCAAQQKSDIVGQTAVKYTMYVGLNDKDTYKQIISDTDAEKMLSDICLKYVDGYTVGKRQGSYKDEKGVVTNESSLVFEFYSANDQQMKSIMDEALVKLNQNSILIEKAKVNYSFYEGDRKK